MGEFHRANITCVPREPIVFNRIRKWYAEVKDIKFEHEEMQKQYEEIKIKEFEKEVCPLLCAVDCWKIDEMELIVKEYDIRFCHNDLNASNIIFDKKTNTYAFVDFEYAGYSYGPFDIGNFFCECTGYNVDLDHYPDANAQQLFIEYYLTALKGNTISNNIPTITGKKPSGKEIRKKYIEANKCVLVRSFANEKLNSRFLT